jgi:hypothetical protein
MQPHLLRSDCLHTPAAPRLAPRKPHHLLQPRAQPPHPQHTPSMHSRRSQAPANSASCRRCKQRTTEVQLRQLRHPQETRCQRRCPSCSDPIACTHRRPSARSSQAPPPATAPGATSPSPQHATSSTHCRRSQAPANSTSPADSVQERSSVVSCAILPRLGASDAAPSSPI